MTIQSIKTELFWTRITILFIVLGFLISKGFLCGKMDNTPYILAQRIDKLDTQSQTLQDQINKNKDKYKDMDIRNLIMPSCMIGGKS